MSINLLDSADQGSGLQETITTSSQSKYGDHWSIYQNHVFDQIETSDNNLLIQAVAGSGKSTTIIEGMRYAQGSSLFMAFNKAIALDIAQKVAQQSYESFPPDVKTLNALGHKLWMTYEPKAKLDFKKSQQILQSILGDSPTYREFNFALSRLIGLAKGNAVGILSPASANDFSELADAYDLNIPAERLEELGEVALKAFTLSRERTDIFDFDDQLYTPLDKGWDYPRYRNVFVDECQDLNPVQHLMLDRMWEDGSRIIAVGDSHQAIYGFRGALTDSMERLGAHFGMTQLPLSISYRCKSQIVQEAKIYCPHIEHFREGGLVEYQSDHDPRIFKNVMVICRTNAPLFTAIMRHVRAKEPCIVLSNFLESLQGFIRSFKVQYTSQLLPKLEAWREKEIQKAKEKSFRGKIFQIEDKFETMKMFCAEYKTADEIIWMLKKLSDSRTGPVFSTVHKAKGLEHENVYILRPEILLGFDGDPGQQDRNLAYVAVTRAKDKLTYGAMR